MQNLTIKTQNFCILISTILLLSLITLHFSDNAQANHQAFLKQVQQIEQHISLLKVQALKVNQGLLKNYDYINKNKKSINHKVQQLYNRNILSQKGNQKTTGDLNKLLDSQVVVSNSVDPFLTDRTTITNAMIALPILIESLKSNDLKQLYLSEQLLKNIFLYIRWQKPATKNKITNILTKLEMNNDNQLNNKVFIYIKAHSNIVLSKTRLITTHLNIILSEQLTHNLMQVQTNTIEGFNDQLKHKQYLDWAIYSISIMLVVLVLRRPKL